MRFPQAIRIPLFLVAVLAAASVVSSLYIPRKFDPEPALIDLAKRAPPPKDDPPAPNPKDPNPKDPNPKDPNPKDPNPPATRRPASVPANPPPKATPAASTSAPASSLAGASTARVNSSVSNANTLASTMTGVSLPSDSMATQTGGSNATGTGSVPTGGLSGPAIGGMAAVGCVALIGAAIFAAMRYKRKASLTQNLGTKNANPYAITSPYGGTNNFPSGGNTGYERLSDPQPVGAMAPIGAPSPPQQQQQQSLGTYTVISTYTPTLGDELEIQPGDKVTLLVEYDDGWCQGVNESRGRVKGVFPKHCVDLGGGQGGMEDMEKSKRVSSMYGASGYRM